MLPTINGLSVPFPCQRPVFEQVLEYYDGPRLILKRSGAGQLYLAWWNDEEGPVDRWIYLPVSESRLSNILSGNIRVMDAMRDPEEDHLVVVDVDVGQGVIQSVATTVSSLPPDSLPFDDVRLNVPLPDGVAGGPARERVHRLAVRIGRDAQIPLEFVSRITSNIQRLVDSIGYALVFADPPTAPSRVPHDDIIKEQTRLNLVSTYAGSLGLLLETDKEDNHEGQSLVRNSLDGMFNLFEGGLFEGDQASVALVERRVGSMEDGRIRVASRYRDLLSTIGTSENPASIHWYQSSGRMTREFEITPEFVRRTEGMAESMTRDVIRLVGVFESGNIRTRWFRFREYGSDVSISGRIHSYAVRDLTRVSLGRPCTVLVKPRLRFNRATGEERTTYTFVRVDFDADDFEVFSADIPT